MNTTQQIQKNIGTREIILKLESMYQRELSEGYGINSESMKEYAMIRDEGLVGVKKMDDDN